MSEPRPIVGNGDCTTPSVASDDVDVHAASASRPSPSSATRCGVDVVVDFMVFSLANR